MAWREVYIQASRILAVGCRVRDSGGGVWSRAVRDSVFCETSN